MRAAKERKADGIPTADQQRDAQDHSNAGHDQ